MSAERLREAAEVLRGAADHLAALAQERYPTDVFLKPTSIDYRQINELLREHRGHYLDGVAADMMRRAYAGCARGLRDMADDRDALADVRDESQPDGPLGGEPA